MPRPLLAPDAARDLRIHCRVLSEYEAPDGLGFFVETSALTPPLRILQLTGNAMVGAWSASSQTPCCFSHLRMEHRGSKYYEVCKECGQAPPAQGFCGTLTNLSLEAWLLTLLPPHWTLLDRELYLPSLHSVMVDLIGATEEAVQPLALAMQQQHRVHFSELYRRYEYRMRADLQAAAMTFHNSVL